MIKNKLLSLSLLVVLSSGSVLYAQSSSTPSSEVDEFKGIGGNSYGYFHGIWHYHRINRTYHHYWGRIPEPRTNFDDMQVKWEMRPYSNNVFQGFKLPNRYSGLSYKMQLVNLDVKLDPKSHATITASFKRHHAGVNHLYGNAHAYMRYTGGRGLYSGDHEFAEVGRGYHIMRDESQNVIIPYTDTLNAEFSKRFIYTKPIRNVAIPNSRFSYVYKTKWFKHRRRTYDLVGIKLLDKLTGKYYYRVNKGRNIRYGVNLGGVSPNYHGYLSTGETNMHGVLSIPSNILEEVPSEINMSIDFSKRGNGPVAN